MALDLGYNIQDVNNRWEQQVPTPTEKHCNITGTYS